MQILLGPSLEKKLKISVFGFPSFVTASETAYIKSFMALKPMRTPGLIYFVYDEDQRGKQSTTNVCAMGLLGWHQDNPLNSFLQPHLLPITGLTEFRYIQNVSSPQYCWVRTEIPVQ